jgi:hypothetical protein
LTATEETLQMAKIAIKATRTCALFGNKVILNGLSKTEYNGMKGTLGGNVAETERRLVYPIAGSVVEHELSLKPENIFTEKQREGLPHQICIPANCADSTDLIDTCDRNGAISLHEVMCSERDDLAKFLCKYSATCLDVTGCASVTIRQMMCINQLKRSKVVDVLKQHAAKQNIKEETKKSSKVINAKTAEIADKEESCFNVPSIYRYPISAKNAKSVIGEVNTRKTAPGCKVKRRWNWAHQ